MAQYIFMTANEKRKETLYCGLKLQCVLGGKRGSYFVALYSISLSVCCLVFNVSFTDF